VTGWPQGWRPRFRRPSLPPVHVECERLAKALPPGAYQCLISSAVNLPRPVYLMADRNPAAAELRDDLLDPLERLRSALEAGDREEASLAAGDLLHLAGQIDVLVWRGRDMERGAQARSWTASGRDAQLVTQREEQSARHAEWRKLMAPILNGQRVRRLSDIEVARRILSSCPDGLKQSLDTVRRWVKANRWEAALDSPEHEGHRG
jgi:hypothetical protein